jgi:hypothetical protein
MNLSYERLPRKFPIQMSKFHINQLFHTQVIVYSNVQVHWSQIKGAVDSSRPLKEGCTSPFVSPVQKAAVEFELGTRQDASDSDKVEALNVTGPEGADLEAYKPPPKN